MHSVVIHGHFYQPPREDPWLDLLEREPSAAPFHDWNARIEQECYRAVAAARIGRPGEPIERIDNLLEWISFDVGPTLLEWMERVAPDSYRAFLEADRASQKRLGHGNALAMPYHHIILPLASRRDKVTEVRWGIADFRRRFGREPEGMWLPETAVDDETLDVLAAEGIRFTVLAPHQVGEPPPGGHAGWYRTGGGREIALCLYDGGMAHEVAFGSLIEDAAVWGERMLAGGPERALVAIATDGETYGHHRRFGEKALAAMLDRVRGRDAGVENFASFLARHPASVPVQLVAPSSWSCQHGVERWRGDCGCRMDPGTSQAWRAPLRAALTRLQEGLDARFQEEGSHFFEDPWSARDADGPGVEQEHLPVRARELLELQWNALRMFTSCAWFFDDLGRIETRQGLRYALRAIDLSGAGAPALRQALREALAQAVSGDPAVPTGDRLLDALAPPIGPAARAGAGFAAVAAIDRSALPERIGAMALSMADEQRLVVIDTRTGRQHILTVAVRIGPGLAVQVTVEGDGQRPAELGLTALPEPARDEVRRLLTEQYLGVLPARRSRATPGSDQSWRLALREALVAWLDRPPDQVDPQMLAVGLDLVEAAGEMVPFEAQTRFYRLLESRGQDPELVPLISRFGFAPLHPPADRPA